MKIEQFLSPDEAFAVEVAIHDFCKGRDCNNCPMKIDIASYACDIYRDDLPMRFYDAAFNILEKAGYPLSFLDSNGISISETEIEDVFNG